MMRAGLWKWKKQRLEEIHIRRKQRSRFEELVQWDTSEHNWLGGCGPKIYLIAMIDDATSRALARSCWAAASETVPPRYRPNVIEIKLPLDNRILKIGGRVAENPRPSWNVGSPIHRSGSDGHIEIDLVLRDMEPEAEVGATTPCGGTAGTIPPGS